MPWSIRVTRRAARDLTTINIRDAEAIRDALRRLPDEFQLADVKKLGGRRDEWRLRIGRWRAVLELNNDAGIITVLRVLPRDRAYRG